MKNAMYILNSLFFVTVLVVGGILFWVMPRQTVSSDEKRELARQPVATVETVFSGKFEKEFEEFYNDHFVFRDTWIALAAKLKSYTGIQNQEFKVITPTAVPKTAPLSPAAIAPENPNKDAGTIENIDVTATAEAVETPDEEELINEFSKVKGMVIVNGRVVQNFGGSKATVQPFADTINKYRERLDPSVRIYAMIIPAGSDYYLPHEVNKGEMKEKKNIEVFKTLLSPGVMSVPAYDAILPHKKEYVMFRTDHHWTGLGAYYAYTAFAQTAGFRPLALSELTHVKKDTTFLGSLYRYTHEETLKNNPDTLEYYKVPTQYTATIYNEGTENGYEGTLYAESRNNYEVFLGGDLPLMHIKTDNPNNRKILVIKDSFGNAFSTYLAANYSDVYVVDYRHFKGNIPNLMRDNDIDELLFAFGSFAANSNAVVKYGTAMLN